AASLIDTTMTSPTVAYLRFDPPSTLIHRTRLAPELSATSRTVSIWIMGTPAREGPRPQRRSITTQRLVFESGRLSWMTTTSSTLYSLFSSWAWYFFRRVMNLW